jgi:hypothetical protein
MKRVMCEKHTVQKSWVIDRGHSKGGRFRCTLCVKEYNASYRLKHPDKLRSSARKRSSKYREENRERCNTYNKEYCKGYRIRNRGVIKEKRDARRLSYPEKRRKERQLYRARKASSICTVCNGNEYEKIVTGTCYVCLSEPAAQTDHITPLAKQGRHCNLNFGGICPGCNQSKGSRVWPGHKGWDSFVTERRLN